MHIYNKSILHVPKKVRIDVHELIIIKLLKNTTSPMVIKHLPVDKGKVDRTADSL